MKLLDWVRCAARALFRLLFLIILLAAPVLLVRQGFQPPIAADVDHYALAIGQLALSQTHEAQAIRRQIAQGPRDLEQELRAAQKVGLKVELSEQQAPLPPPSLNAAPLYRQMAFYNWEHRFDPPSQESHDNDAFQNLSLRNPLYRQDLGASHRFLDRSLMRLVHQAASRPCCVFQRSWILGPDVSLREYFVIREAARLIHSESLLLALDGHPGAAVQNQALGFRIAAHLAEEPIFVGYLVAISCEAIALEGMKDILFLSNGDPRIAGQIYRIVLKMRIHPSLAHGMQSEAVMARWNYETIRSAGAGPERVRVVQYLLHGDGVGAIDFGGNPQPPLRTRAEETRGIEWDVLLDGCLDILAPRAMTDQVLQEAEAQTLRYIRQTAADSEQPFPRQLQSFAQRAHQFELEVGVRDPGPVRPALRGPVEAFREAFCPTYSDLAAKNAELLVKERVVLAGAALIRYHARTGSFPRLLAEALPAGIIDPFTGRSLRYRREGSGFVVYSAGENGKFNPADLSDCTRYHGLYFRYPLY